MLPFFYLEKKYKNVLLKWKPQKSGGSITHETLINTLLPPVLLPVDYSLESYFWIRNWNWTINWSKACLILNSTLYTFNLEIMSIEQPKENLVVFRPGKENYSDTNLYILLLLNSAIVTTNNTTLWNFQFYSFSTFRFFHQTKDR